jgi:hypothetical protein
MLTYKPRWYPGDQAFRSTTVLSKKARNKTYVEPTKRSCQTAKSVSSGGQFCVLIDEHHKKIKEAIGSKLDHVMEAQRLEQDMRKIGGSTSIGGIKRQSINAYHALHPLFMEMMSTINKDPSKYLHFQLMTNKRLVEANCDIERNSKRHKFNGTKM